MRPVLMAMAAAAALAACEAGVTSTAPSTPLQVDCTASYIAFEGPGKYTCEQFPRIAATGQNPGGIFQTFNAYGALDDGSTVSLQISKALSRGGYYSPNTNPNFSYEQSIKSFSSRTQKALSWSAFRIVNGTRVTDFSDAGQKQCFGFVRFGGLASNGYAHMMRGYFCRAASGSAQYTDEEILSLLGKVVIRDI
jgi:hypothetical protein